MRRVLPCILGFVIGCVIAPVLATGLSARCCEAQPAVKVTETAEFDTIVAKQVRVGNVTIDKVGGIWIDGRRGQVAIFNLPDQGACIGIYGKGRDGQIPSDEGNRANFFFTVDEDGRPKLQVKTRAGRYRFVDLDTLAHVGEEMEKTPQH